MPLSKYINLVYILSVGLQDIYLIILLLSQANSLVFISNFVFWHGWDWWNLEYSRMSACMCAKLLQSRLTLCKPMDCNPPGSSVYGILLAKILEWVAIPSPRASSQPRDWTQASHIAGRFHTEPPGKRHYSTHILLVKIFNVLEWRARSINISFLSITITVAQPSTHSS